MTRGASLGLDASDAHDQELLDHVHPDVWVNPTPTGRYHLVVIGAGTAGLVTASAAAGLGARVALVERALMGGDCLNVGCVPSKAILRGARSWADARASAAIFGGPGVSGEGDFGRVMERMRKLRARLSPIDGARRYRALGVDVFFGNARFVSADTVDVEGQPLHFRRAVIATGGRAAVPPIPGLGDVEYLTNETVFSLTRRPERLVVVGGGPIGCELSQAFARFGSQVTLLQRGPGLLPREDREAAALVHASLERDGVKVVDNATVTGAGRTGGAGGVTVRYTRNGAEGAATGDTLLIATGRAPNVEGLGLDAAGVLAGDRGVQVDDRLRTANPRIFAAGDICSAQQFTHAADFQARMVVQNALFHGRARASKLVVPRVTYTSPELAHIGLTGADAEAAHIAVDRVHVPFHDVDRAILDGEEEGLCTVWLARGSDRIVGATVVGSHAGEMIGELALAITARVGLGAVGRTIHPYPTQGEVFRKAADQWRRRKLTPLVARLFAAYFRFIR